MSPKFVVRINDKGKPETFYYDEPGPVPPLIAPPDEETQRDGGVAKEAAVPAPLDPEKKPA